MISNLEEKYKKIIIHIKKISIEKRVDNLLSRVLLEEKNTFLINKVRK